jgi:hypothetical protein
MLQDQGVIQTNAQDKAIWKIAIDNGNGWKNSFTVLKLSPALIWTDPRDRPSPYSGTVTVEAGDANDGVEAAVQLSQQQSRGEAPPADMPPAPSVTSVTSPAISDSDEIASLLSLFDSVVNPQPPPETSGPASLPSNEARIPEASTTAPPEAIADVPSPLPNEAGDLGATFVEWLRAGLVSRRIIINDTKALVHTVDATAMLVTPGIFKRFVQEFPALEAQATIKKVHAWQLVQRAFEKQKLHKKTEKGLNIWTCKVAGPRSTKQLKGYLLKDPLTVFVDVPFDNPSLSIEASSVTAI